MNQTFVSVVHALLGRTLLPRLNFEVSGLEHVPRGAAIIASNHLGVFDPPATLVALRRCAPPRHVYYLGKRSLFEMRFAGIPWLAWILRQIDAIPLDPEKADLTAFKAALRHLEAGRLVGIFPEGGITWTHQPKPALPGLALLAHLAQARVVPLGITGTRPLWWREADGTLRFNHLQLRFGRPIAPPPRGRMSDEARLAFSQDVVDTCYGLVARSLERSRAPQGVP